MIEAGRGRLIKQPIMGSLGHGSSCVRPAAAGPARRLDDEAPWLSVQLDLIGQLRLIQENFRNANASRVANPDDTGLGRHVLTL